jgi:DnaJ homolog subfamily C member 7
MVNPRLGHGLAPPAPSSRRAPRLAKRRHAAATPRSRAPRVPAGTWNPFSDGAGSSDATGQDGKGGALSGDGGGAGFGKADTGGVVFGAAPVVSQQPLETVAAASPSEAPFLFGSVRDSLPQFEEGWSASSKLLDKMANLKLGTPDEAGAAFGQRKDQRDGTSVFGVAISGLVPNSEVNVLPKKLTQLNLGTGMPLQNESGNTVPKRFVFGGTVAEHSASSRNTAAVGDHPFPSSSVLGTNAKTAPEVWTQFSIGNQAPSRGMRSEHSDGAPTVFMFGGTAGSVDTPSTKNDSTGANISSSSIINGSDDASVLPEKITRLNIGSDLPLHCTKSGGSHQPEVFTFGSGGIAGGSFGNETSSTSERGSEFLSANSNIYSLSSNFLSTANSKASSSTNCAENSPPEKTSDLNTGDEILSQSVKSDNANSPSAAFPFGRNGTWTSILQSASTATEEGSNLVNNGNTNTCTSAQGTAESALPEKMTKLNIGRGIPSHNSLDETATRPPEGFVFGTNVPTFSSAQSANTLFTHFQANVSTEPKGKGGNFPNEYTSNSSCLEANIEQGYGPSTFVFGGGNASAHSEGATEYTLHEEIKKLNIDREWTSFRVNDSSTPDFLFKSKAKSTSGFGSVPQPKDQEPLMFTKLNHSSTSATYPNAVPFFSSGTRNAEKEANPSESCAVKQDLPGCSREALFGLESIKSAYRDKKEVHKNKRKNKRPTRLKQHAQLHQVSQETCANGEAPDLAGEYSPMDCSPYPATPEHASTGAHVFDSSISKDNSSCAEDVLVSATEHLVIDADVPTFRNEGRVVNVYASEGIFGSSFSSFEEGLSNTSQYSFTSVNIETNVDINKGTTEICADGDGCNVNQQARYGSLYRTPHEFGELVGFQSSSSNFSGLNFSFGASSSPQSLLSAQRHNTRRKLRTKGGPASKPSTTHAFVQPKSSQDTKAMEFIPEGSKNRDSANEQPARDASAALQTCETWRTRFVWNMLNFVLVSIVTACIFCVSFHVITQILICSTFSISFVPVGIKRMQMTTLLQQRIIILVE